MGYLHIGNLYKAQDILLFRECFALEKVHGTSTHVSFKANNPEQRGAGIEGALTFFSGGASAAHFETLFDKAALLNAFGLVGHAAVTELHARGREVVQAWDESGTGNHGWRVLHRAKPKASSPYSRHDRALIAGALSVGIVKLEQEAQGLRSALDARNSAEDYEEDKTQAAMLLKAADRLREIVAEYEESEQ